MTNEIIALIIKAQNKNEAEQKAEYVIDNELVYDTLEEWELGKDYDFGTIIGYGRQNQQPSFLGNFDAAIKNSGFGEPISSPWTDPLHNIFIQTSQVISDMAKEFINWLSDDDCPGPSGGKPMDEKGRTIEQNDSRLHDKDYFVVPVRVHY